jgi:hypothetical protein
MPFDLSGNFTRSYNYQQDRDNGIKILAARVDGEFDNFATGMNLVFFRDGRVPMAGELKLGTQRVTGLMDGAVAAPAIRFNTDPNTGPYLESAGVYALSASGAKRLSAHGTGVNVYGTLSVTGNSSFAILSATSLSSSGTLTVSTATTLNTLTVGGASSFIGAASFGTISASNTITASNTIIGPAGTTALASFRAPHGVAPTVPTNGDMWTTTAGLFGRINGVTQQFAPLTSPTFLGTPSAPYCRAGNQYYSARHYGVCHRCRRVASPTGEPAAYRYAYRADRRLGYRNYAASHDGVC